MFGAIKKLSKNIQSINMLTLMEQVIDEPEVQAQMIDLVNNQMDAGIDASGGVMPEYSYTSVVKYGKEPGPFTLFDTGDTRGSMKVLTGTEAFAVGADTELHGADLTNLFEPSLGLTNESRIEIMPEIKERLQEKVREKIFS